MRARTAVIAALILPGGCVAPPRASPAIASSPPPETAATAPAQVTLLDRDEARVVADMAAQRELKRPNQSGWPRGTRIPDGEWRLDQYTVQIVRVFHRNSDDQPCYDFHYHNERCAAASGHPVDFDVIVARITGETEIIGGI